MTFFSLGMSNKITLIPPEGRFSPLLLILLDGVSLSSSHPSGFPHKAPLTYVCIYSSLESGMDH